MNSGKCSFVQAINEYERTIASGRSEAKDIANQMEELQKEKEKFEKYWEKLKEKYPHVRGIIEVIFPFDHSSVHQNEMEFWL